MKSIEFAKVSILITVLATSGCGSENSIFDGRDTSNTNGILSGGGSGGGVLSGGGSGGSGGSGGNTGGAGGSSTAEVIFAPGQVNGIGQIQLSGDSSRFVFADDSDTLGTNPDEEWQIWSVAAATGSVTQLTAGTFSAFSASAKVDSTDSGDQVVFITSEDLLGSNPNGRPNVFLANTDASAVTQVTALSDVSAGLREAIISGDGSLIAFTSDSDLTGSNAALDTHVFTINSDGTNLTQVTTLRAVPTSIAFSDDGSKIAFHGVGDPLGTNPSTAEIFVMNTDGSNLAQLTSSDADSYAPLLSDDGTLAVFTSRGDLVAGSNADGSFEVFVARTDGGGITQISDGTVDSGGGGFSIDRPKFSISGNGDYVAFSSAGDFTGANPNGNQTLFWAPSTGGAVSQVLRPGTIQDGATNLIADEPSLSNNGAVIGFVSSTNFTADTQPSNEKIYVIPRQ